MIRIGLTTASLIIRYEVPSQDAQPYREGERLRRQGLCRGLGACSPAATSRDGVGHVTGMWDRRAGMGAYSVPEHIRATRPRGTMVKAISGHHCACEYRSAAEGGRRRTRMGRCVGKIEEGRGYVPNSGRASGSEITTPGSGDWAVALSASAPVRGLLGEHFHADDADRIWALARVSCVRGVTPARDARRVWEQSALSLALPSVALGERDRGGPPGALGRRQGPVLASGRALAEASSRLVAARGRVVGSGSLPDDLAGKGYRLGATHCDQTSLPVAYDALGGSPLACRIAGGGLPGEASLADLVADVPPGGVPWPAGSGSRGAANVELLSSGNNDYIMPPREGLRAREDAVAEMDLRERLGWARGRKATVVEREGRDAGGGRRVLVLRDCDQAAPGRANYLRYLAQGRKGYAEDGFASAEPFFGVCVPRASLADATAEQVWDHYKRRWAIETYYDWPENGMGLRGLCQRDYCRAQGLAFVCLVASLVRRELADLVGGRLPGRTVDEALLDARLVKAHLRAGRWGCCNCKGSVRRLFDTLGVPLEARFPIPAPAHT